MLAAVFLGALMEVVGGRVIRTWTIWQIVWVRYTVHLLITLAVCGFRASPVWRTNKPTRQIVRSAMMLLMPGTFAIALARGAVPGMAFAIFWIAPLILMAVAWLTLGERQSPRGWAIATLGWAAAWEVYAPSGRPSLLTVGLSLGMAASFALYIVMTRDLRDQSLGTNLFYTAVVPWVTLLPLMPRVWVMPQPVELAGIAVVGAAGWLGLLATDRAASAAPVSRTAPLLPLQLAFTVILALFAARSPRAVTLAAAVVLMLATGTLLWFLLEREPRGLPSA